MNVKLFYEATEKKSKNKKEFNWNHSWVFSNFYSDGYIMIDGTKWLNVEHYFQAQKFNIDNEKYQEYYNIMKNVDSPKKAKMLGSQKKDMRFGKKWKINKINDHRLVNDVIDKYNDLKMREDWNDIKIMVMFKALYNKFKQNKNLHNILINEIKDNDYLVEHTTRDKIWGDGGDKGTDEKGSNLLGKLLTSLHHVMKYENCDNMPEEIKNKIKDINL